MLEGFSGGLIVAIVDFFMVFLVLGGLAVAIMGLEKIIQQWERKAAVPTTQPPQPETIPIQEAMALPKKDQVTPSYIAAILAALQEFTGLPVGSFKINAITPCETMPAEFPNSSHIAAVSAALHEYVSSPGDSFRMNEIPRFVRVSPWKMAGRMELMSVEGRVK